MLPEEGLMLKYILITKPSPVQKQGGVVSLSLNLPRFWNLFF